jgi:hypothetical protein
MKNEAIQLYDEALKEANGKTDEVLVQIIRRKLEERINKDRDRYLLYEVKYSINNPVISIEGIISIAIAIVALIISLVSIFAGYMGQNLIFAGVIGLLGISGTLACIVLLIRIYLILDNFHKYRIISYILEEIGIEMACKM